MNHSLNRRICLRAVRGCQRVRLLAGLSLAFSACLAAVAGAQTPSGSASQSARYRNESGWVESKPTPEGSSASSRVQLAMYQQQSSFSDGLPPPLPANFGASSGNGGVRGGYPADPGLPSMFTDQAPGVAAAGSRTQSANAAEILPPRLPAPNQGMSDGGYRAPVVPPNQMRSASEQQGGPSANASAQPNFRDPRSVPAEPAGYTNNQPANSRATANDLRPIPQQLQRSAAGNGQGNYQSQGRLAPSQVATGLPYVTPPPDRVGNFPTRPINPAMFQLAAYQRTAPVNPPPTTPGDVARAEAALAAEQQRQQLARQQQQTLVAQQSTPLRPTLPQFQNAAYANNIYNTAAYQQCAPALNFPATGVVPGNYVPPTVTPNLTPNLYSANNSGYRPLFSLGQENYNVLLGRGLIGQPTVYVPGQYIRNFLRYISP